jgi:chromosome segregation ATPase
MSERDLVRELKETIKDLSKDRDDALDKVKSKESRLKQTLIKLEHATDDVQSLGHKIGEQNKKMADMEAKLHTKEKLLDEALERIKTLTDDSTTETDTDTDDKELD